MVLPLAVAALAAVAGLQTAQAITPNCFFNVSMTDNSPLLHYEPPGAWYSIFVNSKAGSWQPGMMGAGDSSHGSFGLGPKITVEYPGTLSYARGGLSNVSSTPIDFQVDGVKQPQPLVVQNTVFRSASTQDIAFGSHTATFALDATSTNPEALLMFQLFQSLTGVAFETDDPSQVSCKETEFAKEVSGSANFILRGDWRSFQTFGGVNGQPQIDYSSMITNNTGSVSLYPPKGSNYFYLNGTVGNAYGLYTVDFEPAPPYPRQVNTFNSSNSWEVPGENFYYTPLDPDVEYKITVTGDKDTSKYLGLHSWQYCSYKLDKDIPPGSSTTGLTSPTDSVTPAPGKKSSNVGAIAGGVVGGVLGAALIAGLLFWFCRRNRNKKDGLDADPAMFTVDDTVDATTPYRGPAGGGAKLAQDQAPYGTYAGPTYGQQFYQEPNMAEVGYGGPNPHSTPLLAPFGSSDQSGNPSRQGSGPFGDANANRSSSGQWGASDASGPSLYPGSSSDQRQSFGAASTGLHSGYASATSGSGYPSATNEKSIPAHRQLSRVEHEEDAGGLPMPAADAEPEVERLPPTYNPHWLEARTSDSGPSSSTPPQGMSMAPGAASGAFGDSKGPNPGERALPQSPPHDVTAYTPPPQSGAPAPFQPPHEK